MERMRAATILTVWMRRVRQSANVRQKLTFAVSKMNHALETEIYQNLKQPKQEVEMAAVSLTKSLERGLAPFRRRACLPSAARFFSGEASLWDRMGGETKIRPMCNDLYDRHASDPITASWFPPSSTWNIRTADEVKENVFTFFSAAIGGPYE